MPARTISPAETARGVAIVSKKTLIARKDDKGRGADAKIATGKSNPAPPAKIQTKTPDKGKGIASRDELILAAIKTHTTCNEATVDSLLAHLEVTNNVLQIPIVDATGKGKAQAKASSSSSSMRAANGSRKAVMRPVEFQCMHSFNSSRVHFAKQVVNSVITSLNEVISAGWKPSTLPPLTQAPKPARTNSNTSRSSSTASSRKDEMLSVSSVERRSASTPMISEGNIISIFSCARIAIHYLCKAQDAIELKLSKELELQSIMSSLVRKLVSMDLCQTVSSELDWLHNTVVESYSKLGTIPHYEFPIPTTPLSDRQMELLLEIQVLSINCCLMTVEVDQVPTVLEWIMQSSSSVIAWQLYLRNLPDENRNDIADKHAYSIERAINKAIARINKIAGGKCDQTMVLKCRKYSLDLLLHVSDLDADAFWDRTSRVGYTYLKSTTSSESKSHIERQATFQIVDDIFRDVYRRAEQVASVEETRGVLLHQGKGFTTFCETWMQLAKRTGNIGAIEYVAVLLKKQKGKDLHDVGDEDIEDLLIQSCATLDQSVIALDILLSGQSEGADSLRLAESNVSSALRLAIKAEAEGLKKVFRILDQLRRRGLKLMEETDACDKTEITALLLTICKHYEQYLNDERVTGRLDNDEEILDNYIYILRSLSNSTFVLTDWTTHEAAATFLNQCSALLEQRRGRMKSISGDIRSAKLRLLSSSWYYIGGKLYNERKLSMAIRFLKSACETAQEASDLFQIEGKEMSSTDKAENITKKWEHLAVSYRYTNQSELAYQAYTSALLSADASIWKAIIDRVRKEPICNVFISDQKCEESDKNILSLASMIKSAFELLVFDLLKAESIAKDDGFARLLVWKGTPRESVAAILEYCLLSLDETMHREGALAAASTLIEELLQLYCPGTTPIRRARVLIRKVELTAMQPQLLSNSIASEAVHDAAKEARELMTRQRYNLDESLVAYLPQYHATLSMSLLFFAQRQKSDPKADTFSTLVDDISVWLDRMLEMMNTENRVPSKARTLQVIEAPKQIRQVKKPPVTPKSNRGKQATVVVIPKKKSLSLNSQIDNESRLCRIIEMIVESIDSSGQTLPLMKLVGSALPIMYLMKSSIGSDTYLNLSTILFRTFIILKLFPEAQQIMTRLGDRIKGAKVGADNESRFLFVNAQYHAHIGKLDESIEMYNAAVILASRINLEEKVSSLQNGVNRCLVNVRQALASETYSIIERKRGDYTSALRYALLNLRCVMKSTMMLTRLTSVDEAQERSSFPFGQSGQLRGKISESTLPSPSAINTESLSKQSSRLNSLYIGKVHERMTGALVRAYLSVAHLYKLRGSARDAEAFLGEAFDLCKSSSIPIVLAHVLIDRSLLQFVMGMKEKAIIGVKEASNIFVGERNTPGAIHLQIAQAEEVFRYGEYQSALQYLERAEETRSDLDEKLRRCIGIKIAKDSISSSDKNTSKIRPLLSELKGEILLHRTRILQRVGDTESSAKEANQARTLLNLREDGELELQEAGNALQVALESLKMDQVLGMLHESVLSMPMVQYSSKEPLQSMNGTIKSVNAAHVKSARLNLKVAQELLQKLSRKEKWQQIDSLTLREACVSLALITSLGSALGDNCKRDEVASILERACSITLQREMLDAIESKVDERMGLSVASIPGWETTQDAATRDLRKSSEDSSSDQDSSTEGLRKQLDQIRARHAAGQFTQVEIPSGWIVVSITLYKEQNCLVMTRRESSDSSSLPIVFHLPIDRHNHREGEDNPQASIEAVFSELKTIIDESNEATQSAQHLQGMQARKDWWTKRRDLDSRMKEILAIVETTWLGAFKSILMPRSISSVENFTSIRNAFDAFFQKSLFTNTLGDRDSVEGVIDQDILESFIALSQTTCTDEELEDLIHYVMDVYQFNGCPVAIDEVDMDQCVTDLRTILDFVKSKIQMDDTAQQDDHHLFLILDKDTSAIPWESIPILRNQAVCRIPSLAFLRDRLEQIRRDGPSDRFTLSSTKAKVSYLLNPSKDLSRTQERFGPWLEGNDKKIRGGKCWSGISNRVPLMDELANALEENDLMLYFGHGGAEQYIRASRLKALKRCAVTMLWGCSSAVLRDLGDYDRTGTPYNYLMAGCPSLLGNLWDITDKELDGISESVFKKMGLWKGNEKEDGGKEQCNLSIAQAVAQSRDACKLPYLTGAACVIYGIPVYYQ